MREEKIRARLPVTYSLTVYRDKPPYNGRHVYHMPLTEEGDKAALRQALGDLSISQTMQERDRAVIRRWSDDPKVGINDLEIAMTLTFKEGKWHKDEPCVIHPHID